MRKFRSGPKQLCYMCSVFWSRSFKSFSRPPFLHPRTRSSPGRAHALGEGHFVSPRPPVHRDPWGDVPGKSCVLLDPDCYHYPESCANTTHILREYIYMPAYLFLFLRSLTPTLCTYCNTSLGRLYRSPPPCPFTPRHPTPPATPFGWSPSSLGTPLPPPFPLPK